MKHEQVEGVGWCWWLKHGEEVPLGREARITEVLADWPDARPEHAIPPASFHDMILELKAKCFATLLIDGRSALQGPVGDIPMIPGFCRSYELKTPLLIKPDTKIHVEFGVAPNAVLLHGANLSQLDFILVEKP